MSITKSKNGFARTRANPLNPITASILISMLLKKTPTCVPSMFFNATLISKSTGTAINLNYFLHEFWQYKIDNFELPTNIYHKLCLKLRLVNFLNCLNILLRSHQSSV